MLNKFSLSLTAALLSTSVAFAVDMPAAEEPSSQERIIDLQVKTRQEYNNTVNGEIYRAEDSDLKELVRNANALNKRENPEAQDIKVNVDNKEQMRKFINKQLGVAEISQPEK